MLYKNADWYKKTKKCRWRNITITIKYTINETLEKYLTIKIKLTPPPGHHDPGHFDKNQTRDSFMLQPLLGRVVIMISLFNTFYKLDYFLYQTVY